MDQDIVRLLTDRAIVIGREAARFLPPSNNGVNDFERVNWDTVSPTVTNPTYGVLRVRFNPHCHVEFAGIAPKSVTRRIIHEPLLLTGNQLDAASFIIRNDSDAIVEETYSYERSETRTDNVDVGYTIEAGFTQKIAYGGAASPVSGETGFSLSVSNNYNRHTGSSNTESNTASRTIAVPPRTSLTVSSQVSEGSFSQRLEYWCDLDHEVRIASHNDFHHVYTSLGQLKDAANGQAPDDIPGSRDWKNHRSVHAWSIGQPIEVYYDTTINYTNSTNGNVTITSNDLSEADA